MDNLTTIRTTIQEFLSKVAAPRGLTIAFIDGNCRPCVETGEDWICTSGPNEKYIVSNESIREYYAIRDRPSERPKPSPGAKIADEFIFEEPEKPRRAGNKA